MNYPSLNQGHNSTSSAMENTETYLGQRWLVEERDACGVGFIAHRQNIANHEILAKALNALTCLEHRGGCSADQDSGDGAGILTAIPWELLQQEGIQVANTGNMAVGMIFLPQEEESAQKLKAIFEQVATEENLTVLGWREVPVNAEILGIQARENQPRIEQVFLSSDDKSGDELEREMYITRRRVVKAAKEISDEFYVCSLSTRTIVYKGMVRSAVLGDFYQDLKNPAFKCAFAVYHRRFSTNTMPKWPLAQPMRLLGHNGEINTLLGNINWMMAREATLDHPIWKGRAAEFKPLVNIHSSDSATLDNVLELLVRSGRTPEEGLMMMVPEAYKNQPSLTDYPEIVDFYEYYSGLQEAWDGPALLVFSDGNRVGATLDRNGLRPARYLITKDDYIVVASEAGVVDFPEENILEKGRLGPGQMIAVDLISNEILKNWDIKQRIAKLHPYGEWLNQNRQELKDLVKPASVNGNGNGNGHHMAATETSVTVDRQSLLQQQIAFGYTSEDVDMIIQPMAENGGEPTFCMGDDIPLAVLSEKPRLLYDYFKQRFAQVTNPPIDPLREKLVMSLTVELGERGNLLEPKAEHARRLKLNSPVLTDAELEAIKLSGFGTAELSTLFPISAGPEGLKMAVENLQKQAAESVRAGAKILILSDKIPPTPLEKGGFSPTPLEKGGFSPTSMEKGGKEVGIGAEYSYIPPLLAVGAVHHYLIREGVRMKTSLVVHTAQCWSTHHFACLLGYGAGAICPYMALDTVRSWWGDPRTQQFMERGKINPMSLDQAIANYRQAVESGLLKILSKMGISLLSSYQAAQIFEAIGIGGELLNLAFRGTTSRIGGINCQELAQEVLSVHSKAFPELSANKLENLGFVQFRPSGEYHSNSPELVKALHKAVDGKKYDHYEVYKQHLQNRPVTALRDLLDFESDRPAISIDEVEAVSEIAKRFCTGGMSLGALSREAHETLAIAMNRIGGKSNSGEGGEDPVRYTVLNDVDASGNSPTLPHLHGLRNGDTASSAIKQVASGRFGVTPGYLASAKQIEIKMAQGAKPGEGGQLPGKKVSPYIAMLRRSKPGVTLIS
ncbi:MAG: glutamate synthase subunit alpha, partial [Nostocales cyanobacterium]